MADLATATANLAAIESAMANGVQSVTYSDGRSVRYHSMGDMQKAAAYWRAQVKAAGGSTQYVRVAHSRD